MIGGGGLTGVYESGNEGATVTSVTPSGLVGATNQSVVTAITYAAAGGTAYVASSSGQLFERNGNGSLTLINSPNWGTGIGTSSYSGAFANSITTDPNDPSIVYLVDNTGRVWGKYDANGWVNLTGNLSLKNSNGSLAAANIQVYDPPGAGLGNSVLLVGGFGGTYRMNDALDTADPTGAWSLFGQGLPDAAVSDVQYVPQSASGHGNVIVASVFGRGVWEISNAASYLSAIPQVAGVAANDATIVLRNDPANSANAQLLVNNQLELEQPWADIPQIAIDTWPGTTGNSYDTIDIEQSGSGTTVEVNLGLGSETINLGDSRGLNDILGNVTIDDDPNPGSSTINIVLNDRGDTAAQDITVEDLDGLSTWGQVTGLGQNGLSDIDYEYSSNTTLTVDSDAAVGNAINVYATGVTTDIQIDAVTYVYLGSASDGSQDLFDSVSMSSYEGGTPDEGNLFVTIDDLGDPTPRTATVTTFTPLVSYGDGIFGPDTPWGSISGMTPNGTTISYEYADTNSVSIEGSSSDHLVNDQTGSGQTPVSLNTYPVVTGISPDEGPLSGGTVVTIIGTGLNDSPSVLFGSSLVYPDPNLTNTATTLHVIAPPVSTPQTVNLTVFTNVGFSLNTEQFNYLAQPVVNSVSPGAGPLSDGATVTIIGTNFGGVTAVDFGLAAGTVLSDFRDPLNPNLDEILVTPPAVQRQIHIHRATADQCGQSFRQRAGGRRQRVDLWREFHQRVHGQLRQHAGDQRHIRFQQPAYRRQPGGVGWNGRRSRVNHRRRVGNRSRRPIHILRDADGHVDLHELRSLRGRHGGDHHGHEPRGRLAGGPLRHDGGDHREPLRNADRGPQPLQRGPRFRARHGIDPRRHVRNFLCGYVHL
jgi:hypothetical protein